MSIYRYEMHREEFVARCKNCVQNSRLRIYDKSSNDDPHYLLFDEYNSNIHEPYREMLIKEKNAMMVWVNDALFSFKERDCDVCIFLIQEIEDGRAISWIQDGTLESLSKHHWSLQNIFKEPIDLLLPHSLILHGCIRFLLRFPPCPVCTFK